MSRERRNHYRLLYVQPEAPFEVIKAAYRALMGSARVHPDLGGDNEQAARLNAAYAVLSDPERRRAYDLSLRRPARAAAAPEAAAAATVAGPHCAFCRRAYRGTPGPDTRCAGCGSPLHPAPRDARQAVGSELLGRRRGERFACQGAIELRLPDDPLIHTARLRDLSFSGLSLVHAQALPAGAVMRVQTAQFEAVVQVVGSRRQTAGHTVHARLLTLRLQRGARGVYVNTQA
jgi:curved DNA-binding protein CbpA